MNLALLKYVKHFSDGRIRIRHKALHMAQVAETCVREIKQMAGVTSVEVNMVSGSVLILYDPGLLSRDMLIERGTAWAEYLDACAQGKKVEPPSFS